MVVEAQFVVAIHKTRCLSRISGGVKLLNGLRLLDDPSRVVCLKDPSFQESIGGLELNSLRNSKLLAATDLRAFDIGGESSGPTIVAGLLNILRIYLFHLWTLKDNCAYFEQGFLFVPSTGTTHSNLIVTSFCKADGTTSTTDLFSAAELEMTRLRLRSAHGGSDIPSSFENVPVLTKNTFKLVSAKNVDRYSRFQVFILFARESRDLGLKIAIYCSALETLLSGSSTSELTHRISERVALILGREEASSVLIYSKMKKIYSIRSAVVHGGDIASKASGDICKWSKECDQIVREVAICVEGSAALRSGLASDDLDDFFLRWLFKRN